MPTRDVFEAVGAIAYPLPDAESFAANNPHMSRHDRGLILSDLRSDALREREEYVAELRQSADNDETFDPLMSEIARWRGQMLHAERMMRFLIAYGREFVRPQPYPLKDLAGAAGLSISGVRIAYDDDEIREVAALTGDKPRRPLAEPEG